MPEYSGFAKLGELLGGGQGGGTTSDAYLSGLTGGYRAQSAMHDADKSREEARIMRARAVARDGLPAALETAGYQENLRPLFEAVLGSNATMDLDQLGKYAVVEAAPAFAAAAAAGAKGNLSEQNRNTALAQGQQYDPFTAVGGGNAVLRKDTGDLVFSQLGDVIVDLRKAQTEKERAAAAENAAQGRFADAGADLRGRTDPQFRAPRAGAKPGKPTAAPKPGDELDGYRFKGGDPAKKENWERM